jgi:hypothetical protein
VISYDSNRRRPASMVLSPFSCRLQKPRRECPRHDPCISDTETRSHLAQGRPPKTFPFDHGEGLRAPPCVVARGEVNSALSKGYPVRWSKRLPGRRDPGRGSAFTAQTCGCSSIVKWSRVLLSCVGCSSRPLIEPSHEERVAERENHRTDEQTDDSRIQEPADRPDKDDNHRNLGSAAQDEAASRRCRSGRRIRSIRGTAP